MNRETLLDVAHWFNPRCTWCDATRLRGYPLCAACHASLPWLAQPWLNNSLTMRSAFAYQGAIRPLMLDIKFNKKLADTGVLGTLTATGLLPQLDALPQAIIPVPLHHTRLRQRGFNQALELARPLSKQLHLPLLSHAVIRHKATAAQAELSFEARQNNIQDAFCLSKPLPYQHVAIFDDVITTGATTLALANLLLNSGVTSIEVWSCARAIK